MNEKPTQVFKIMYYGKCWINGGAAEIGDLDTAINTTQLYEAVATSLYNVINKHFI